MVSRSSPVSRSCRLALALALGALSAGCEAPLAPADIAGVYVVPAALLAHAPEVVAADSSVYRIVADTAVLRVDGSGYLMTILSRRVPSTGAETTLRAHTPFAFRIVGSTLRTRLPPLVCAGWCTETPEAPDFHLQGDALISLEPIGRLYRRVSPAAP